MTTIETNKNKVDPVIDLIDSMRITSRCRYNASARIAQLGQYSFFTTTFLSLGLIFIPLVQNSDVPLHFLPKVLNMMQIFLAVAILVYSIIIGTARYDVRAIALNKCGDKVKNLIRALREEKHKTANGALEINLNSYHEKYQEALNESENHTRLDFLFSKLEMPADYKITGLNFIYYKVKAHFFYSIPFVLPTLMIIAEFIFISDMLGITQVMPSYFGGDPTV